MGIPNLLFIEGTVALGQRGRYLRPILEGSSLSVFETLSAHYLGAGKHLPAGERGCAASTYQVSVYEMISSKK